MNDYVLDLIKNRKEEVFVNDFKNIVKNYKQSLTNPQVIPILVKHNLIFNNLNLFSAYDIKFLFPLLNTIYDYDNNYIINNLFSMLNFFDCETFYYYLIVFCENKKIDISKIFEYIENNSITLNNNELLIALKDDLEYNNIDAYLDTFINNSTSLIDLKRLFNKYSFPNEKIELLYKRMDNNPNLIRNEILKSVINLDKLKEDKIVDFIDIIIKELLEYGNLKYHDISFLNEGAYSKVYKIGDKVFKIGERRDTFRIRNSKYFLKPLYRKEIMDKEGMDIMFVLEITEYVDTKDIGLEATYQMYKNLRDEGFVWTDCRACNLGILLKDNNVYFNEISKVDKESTGYITDNDDYLKKGDIVVIDNDYIYEEDKYFKNPDTYSIPSEYFYDFENRYKEEIAKK